MAEKNRVVTIDDAKEQTAAAIPVNAEPVKEIIGVNHDDQLCGDKVQIEIYEGEGDLGKDAVFIQINGYAYQIPRGVKVSVPVEVLGILENATMTVYGTGQGGAQSERKVKRFAYSVIGPMLKAAA